MANVEPVWAEVDRFICSHLLPGDSDPTFVLETSAAAGLPSISVSGAQGKLLFVLARALAATRILEIGTLGGYSGIWLARALGAGGRLVTIEVDPTHAAVARANFERAGVADRIDLRVGRGIDVLPALAAEGAGPFDVVFIDADKVSYPDYFDWSMKLSRPGTLIIADNVVRAGAVVGVGEVDESAIAAKTFTEKLGRDPRVAATAIQTVGAKGYDGFAAMVVL
jgi:predicted O-methyltransferase YrrM